MQEEAFRWQCADGTVMHACEWKSKSKGPAKAVIGIVHGMDEHCGRYRHVAELLTDRGYAVIGFDQRGHGRTEGARGHTPSYEALLEGVDMLQGEMDRRYPDIPRFVFGHSMGGNVTLNHLLRRKPRLDGAIVTGPWLKLAFEPARAAVTVGRMVEKIYPKFANRVALVPEHLTSDLEMLRRNGQDALSHGRITVRFFFAIQSAGEWALTHAPELSVPLLLMHGGDDKVTSAEASREFSERAGANCTFRQWPGFRHELHNETGRSEVFDVLLRWLDERLAESGHEKSKSGGTKL